MLHDDVLLAIFYFYVDEDEEKQSTETWQTLVHVCQRWRSLVFASPCHLDLRLVCTARTSARDTLDVWPALLLEIEDDIGTKCVDNIISVLKLRDRVRKVDLDGVTKPKMEEICRVMQEPFPDLTDLQLGADPNAAPQLPDSFLGGSAPCLQSLTLEFIPFPALPNLLLSASHLVLLHLGIPDSGYISPEAMVTYLSMLTGLESLSLRFESYQSLPDRESGPPPHPMLTVLSALTYFNYIGVSKYLEDFVARIDIPQLDDLKITLFEIDFDSTQLSQFISRTLTLKACDEALVELYRGRARVEVPLFSQITGPSSGLFFIEFPFDKFNEQLEALAWVCKLSSSLLSMVKTLFICDDLHHFRLDDEELDGEWLQLFSPFTTVEELFLSNRAMHRIVPALRVTVCGIQDVLPTLKHVGLEVHHPSLHGHVDIEDFYDAQRLSDFKIRVSL